MKKIGILTIHSDYNYGAVLQAFALTSFLKGKGYDAKIIDYVKVPNYVRPLPFPLNIAYKIFELPQAIKYRRFLKKLLSPVRYNSENEILSGFKEDYDVLVSGSDQIWNPACGGLKKINPVYYLSFASDKYKKVAYASSIGSYVFNKNEQDTIRPWLEAYTHLSTRELAGAKQLESFVNRKFQVVLDPTLLLSKEQWKPLAHKVKVKNPYVLIYYFDTLDEVAAYARKIADKKGWKVVLMTNQFKKHSNVDINIPYIGPAEFLYLFMNANYIVTNSFHGTAFSVNFNKNFISVVKQNSPQRQQTLLQNVGLSERLLSDISQLEGLSIEVDFTDANIKLGKLREDSISYLLNAIDN